VTAGALAGLGALNLAYAVAGVSLLWGVGGIRSWGSLLRLSGLGYLVGLAAFGVVWTTLLVVGVPFGGVGIVLSLAALAAAGVVAGVRRGVPVPSGVPRVHAGPMLLVSATGIALAGLFLEALFRAGRLSSLQEYDAWAFWVPKGKAIFFFGGLDEHVFTTTPNAPYPPLQPILDAAAFHAMGGADVVTLHVQFWFVVVGAVCAAAGLLHRRVPAWLLWPPLLLVLVVPRFGIRLLAPQADALLDVLVVVAALLLMLWLHDRAGWRLAAVVPLLAAAANTKREGLLFAACVLAAALVVTRPRRWPPLTVAGLVVLVSAIPWRVWIAHHDIEQGAPSSPFGSGRLGGAIDLSARVLYSNARWSVLPLVATIALAAALIWGDRRLGAYVGVLSLLLFVGGVWSTAGFPDLAISADESGNPIVRYTGSLIFLAAVSLPLLLASVWRPGEDP
jgi:hypothetical protein